MGVTMPGSTRGYAAPGTTFAQAAASKERGGSLSLRGVQKWYGSLHVLDDIFLEVGRHEVVTVLGPSGCGKTTLLRIVNGLIPHEEGEVLFRSERVTAPRPEMAMVFQHFGLFPWKRLYQNIGYGLRLQGRPAEEIDRIVRHYIGLDARAAPGGAPAHHRRRAQGHDLHHPQHRRGPPRG
jgi:NitT/TauT family transport system ATP-binding protein